MARAARTASVIVLLLGALTLAPSPAGAAIVATTTVSIPSQVTVGQTAVAVEITLTNAKRAPFIFRTPGRHTITIVVLSGSCGGELTRTTTTIEVFVAAGAPARATFAAREPAARAAPRTVLQEQAPAPDVVGIPVTPGRPGSTYTENFGSSRKS